MKPLPGQQSLFDQAAENPEQADDERDRAAADQPGAEILRAAPRAESNNPFLPQHIRDRLAQQKSDRERDLALAHQLSAGQQASSSRRPAANEALLDELVAKYLPLIEADLRRRLRKQLDDE